MVKVVRVGSSRSVGRDKVTTFTIKDVNGDGGYLSAWNKFVDQLELNHVYEILNLVVESYPQKKPHNLRTMMSTKIKDITKEKLEDFEDIQFADGSQNGQIEVFYDLYVYKSCSKCARSLPKESNLPPNFCPKCNTMGISQKLDFKFGLYVQDEDNYIDFTGFRSVLGELIDEMPEDGEALANFLNTNFGGKSVNIQWKQDEKDETKKIIQSFALVKEN